MYSLALIYIVIVSIISLTGINYLWGINILSYYGAPFILIYSLIIGLLLSKNIHNNIDKFITKIKVNYKISFIFAGVLLLLSLIFSQKEYFLGDGFLRIKNTESLIYYSSGSPLGNYFTILIYDKIAFPLGYNAEIVWKFISYLSGLLSVLIFFHYGKKLFDDNKNFVYSFLLIFISGLSQVYFGYIESYPLYYTFLLGYYLSTILLLKNGKFSYSPAIWLISAFFISPTAVIFSPAILFAYYELTLKNNINKQNLINFSKPIIAVLLFTVISFGFLFITGFTIESYFSGLSKVNHILPLFTGAGNQGILDITHLNDILNLLLLVSPVCILIPFYIFRNTDVFKSNIILFLMINLVFSLIFLSVFKPDISFMRDWDLFSIVVYPISFIIITIMINNKNNYNFYLAIMINLFQFIPWIYLNSNEKLSLNRMENIAEIKYLPNYAKSNNYDILRQYYIRGIEIKNPSEFVVNNENSEQIKKSIYYTKLAYDYEKNERYLYSLSLYSFILKDYENAMKYLNLMIESEYSQKHLAYALISKINIELGNIPEAVKNIKKIEETFPESETVKLDIANLYYNYGEPKNAYNYFQKANIINPSNIQTIDYLIELSYIADNKQKTIEYYHQYNSLKPDNPATYYNIALCYSELNIKDSMDYYSNLALKNGFSEELINKLRVKK